jgi:hypothetical protein
MQQAHQRKLDGCRIRNLTLFIDSIEKRRIRSFARQQVGPPD